MRSGTAEVRGPAVETHFVTSRCRRAVHARVPFPAASATARPCRIDGCSHTRRLRAPIFVRCESRDAFKHSRYIRLRSQVNLRKLAVEPVKVDQVARALCLPAATMHDFTSGKHLFELEPTCGPALKLTSTDRRSAAGFGLLRLQMVAAAAWRPSVAPSALRHVGSRPRGRSRAHKRCWACHRRG